ncbi:MAG: penicillin-binding transpeptidase domain-containing protein, partial [Patescibacteria group bacterium]
IEDKGNIKAGAATFSNWYFLQYGKVDGMVDVIKAIRRSNDIFFYKVGERTGVEKIKQWSDIFGLGKRTGIGLDETEGIIPSIFWKKEVLKENWYLGDTYNLSIGQGYVGTTPLQMAFITDVFANGGYLCKPQLLKQNVGACKKLPISQKTIDIIREGMKQACSIGGTGWPLFEFSIRSDPAKLGQQGQTLTKHIQVACKTGTAESHAKSGMPHAWITVFAPYDNPEISVTILVEEGGQGSDVAGPIAKEILKAYFERSQ